VDLGQITVFAAESDPLNVTKIYNNATPTLSNPYVNGDIPNFSILVFFKFIEGANDLYVGVYDNTNGNISGVVYCGVQ
jgi:type VI protein secretion system component Hcp